MLQRAGEERDGSDDPAQKAAIDQAVAEVKVALSSPRLHSPSLSSAPFPSRFHLTAPPPQKLQAPVEEAGKKHAANAADPEQKKVWDAASERFKDHLDELDDATRPKAPPFHPHPAPLIISPPSLPLDAV